MLTRNFQEILDRAMNIKIRQQRKAYLIRVIGDMVPDVGFMSLSQIERKAQQLADRQKTATVSSENRMRSLGILGVRKQGVGIYY